MVIQMIKYTEETVVQKTPSKFICDVCKKEITSIDVDEMTFLNFYGGYSSPFGDMSHVQCDICMDCLYDMIKDHCRYILSE
jgi:hypothetical protein